ncbi:hypothetical protein A0O34_00420 [Chryseobacterium glaciei]|uniref:Uncharacterized protein n=1 Tax=Chryseobacterium glaciei TaxID=1685010 RepID=A0A172XQF9_9FLAO|nr:hypothetical protein [Chryseobacterium glaciei]ANF49110.1 hypothetical protein A0O34_00420 [Chryseobacterium glaciei]
MKKIVLVAFLASGVYAKTQVGIKTTSPTKILDINGDLRIRVLPQGSTSQSLLITDVNGNMLQMPIPEISHSPGDIKDSYATTDHDGWYLLNGRNISTLTATANAVAISLNFNTTLPDFSGYYAKAAKNESLSAAGGNASYTLTKQNMPNFAISGSTLGGGSHSHTATDRTPYGAGPIWGHATDGTVNWAQSTTRTTSSNGAHTHTLSLNSNGSGQAFGLTPAFLAVNTFVYLGL